MVELSRQFPNVTTDITHNLDSFRVRVLGNEFLNDIFVNLIGNSMKFDKSDLAVIDVFADVVTVDGSEHVRVSVIDNGPGIEDSQKDEIFEQAPNKKAGTLRVTGLGLSLVKEIINR